MKKRDFNLVGNEGTDNQELAKGIAFVKSRRKWRRRGRYAGCALSG